MNFPIINTLDDLLPHIEGRKDFIVAEKGDYIFVKYNYIIADTFKHDNPLTESMRRECRGVMFDRDTGRIASRPFHKFFNVDEVEETAYGNLPFNNPQGVYVQRKMDGSMVRPLLDGERRIVWHTKSGFTDVGRQCTHWWNENRDKWGEGKAAAWLRTVLWLGFTPIFEYVGPNNRIVVDYPETELYLLAMRNNNNGVYIDNEVLMASPFPQPGYAHGLHCKSDFGLFIETVRRDDRETEEEGWVLRFPDGLYAKVKNSWYLKRHAVKGQCTPNRLAALALKEELDDVIDLLPKDQQYHMVKSAHKFVELTHNLLHNLLYHVQEGRRLLHVMERKEWVLGTVNRLDSRSRGCVLAAGTSDSLAQDEEKMKARFWEYVNRKLKTEAGYNEMLQWFHEGDAYVRS